MIINADLHIHSPYTKKGNIENNFDILSENAKKKGLDMVATGDCLHPQWLKAITQLEPIDEGTFFHDDIYYVLSTEVQTHDRIHHLLFFPDVTSLYDFKESIKEFNVDLTLGRPNIPVTSEHLALIAIDSNALIGPSHVFDVFTGVYSKYESIIDCYGSAIDEIFFVELGLGIDSYHADLIKELHHLTFLTNSDTHNPHPIRLGREFTQFNVRKPQCRYLLEAIQRKGQNKPVLNAGFPPEEGKYYQTGCIKCQRPYSFNQARKQKWSCTCGGLIKKGMKEKILEKSDTSQYHYPYHRPLYLSLLPLHEILTKTLHQKNPFVETVENYYDSLISVFGNEIHLMLETPVHNIEYASTADIAEMINAFRLATFDYKKGGGGMYGTLLVDCLANAKTRY